MSKLDTLRGILSSTQSLFDRFINIDFYRKDASVPDKFRIVTPRTGAKPNIAVQLKTMPNNMVTQFTVSIMNFSTTVDLSTFSEIEVLMGYYSSGEAYSFRGEVMSVFQESPNPNGILTFQGVVGNATLFSDNTNIKLADPAGSRSVAEYPIPVFLNQVINTINSSISSKSNATHGLLLDTAGLPKEWLSMTYSYHGSSTQCSSIYKALSWLNSELLSIAYSKKLPPIYLYADNANIRVSSTMAKKTMPTLTVLSMVSSVSASGSEVSIICPYIPSIQAETVFYLQSSYYSSVLNTTGITSLSPLNLIKANYTEVKFSTNGTNQMHINGIKLNDITNIDALFKKE